MLFLSYASISRRSELIHWNHILYDPRQIVNSCGGAVFPR
ncbi:hypothetical protein HMPREF1986_02049 [Oribacterium sp. oral taxon 078 str. F0263]|nr:hypothetical protein HMPREF1986_02049 [Oribacterium sp. oral taxon 078 str. F0263]